MPGFAAGEASGLFAAFVASPGEWRPAFSRQIQTMPTTDDATKHTTTDDETVAEFVRSLTDEQFLVMMTNPPESIRSLRECMQSLRGVLWAWLYAGPIVVACLDGCLDVPADVYQAAERLVAPDDITRAYLRRRRR